MADVQTAILDCRATMRGFIDGQIDYPTFRQHMTAAMGPLDPLDWALEGLAEDLQVEATLYSDWLGGEFGESEDLIPKRAEWVYGESRVPYGWVDVDAYRERLRRAFGAICRDNT